MFDAAGNLYASDYTDTTYTSKVVQKIMPNGQVSTVSGVPGGVTTIDPSGNFYTWGTSPDLPYHRSAIYKIAPDGTKTIFNYLYSGPGEALPQKLFTDETGQLYAELRYRNKFNIDRFGLAGSPDTRLQESIYYLGTYGELLGTAMNTQGDLAVIVESPVPNNPAHIYVVPKSTQPAKQNYLSADPPTTPGIIDLGTTESSELAYDAQGYVYTYGYRIKQVVPGTNSGTYADNMQLLKIAPDGGRTVLLDTFPDGTSGPHPKPAVSDKVGDYVSVVVSRSGDVFFSYDCAIYKLSTTGKLTLFAGKPGDPGTSK